MRKILEINEEAEKLLTSVCDMALKSNGMQAYNLIIQLVAKIKNEAVLEEEEK